MITGLYERLDQRNHDNPTPRNIELRVVTDERAPSAVAGSAQKSPEIYEIDAHCISGPLPEEISR